MRAAGLPDHPGMTIRPRPLLPALLLLAGLAGQEPAKAPALPGDRAGETPSDFVRFVTVGDGGRLETAITTYRNQQGAELVLFGAVHIAEPEHYALLQERFAQRERLLYELVASAEDRPRPGAPRGSGGAIGLLQRGLKTSLGLEFQLDAVDYSPANFVHADMEPEEFQKAMRERGESLLSIFFRMMQQSMKMMRENEGPAARNVDLVAAFRQGDGRRQLKLALGTQLEQMEKMALGVDEEGGSTLLEGRNEKCLQVLQRELADGRRRLGIYYGAAHLPHLERRLVQDLGFHKTGHEWIVAWDCVRKEAGK